MARPAKDDTAPSLKRIQMDMTPRAVERLQRLQARLEASSYAETVRRALWLHDTLLKAADGGGRILVERNGVTTEIHIEGASA